MVMLELFTVLVPSTGFFSIYDRAGFHRTRKSSSRPLNGVLFYLQANWKRIAENDERSRPLNGVLFYLHSRKTVKLQRILVLVPSTGFFSIYFAQYKGGTAIQRSRPLNGVLFYLQCYET